MTRIGFVHDHLCSSLKAIFGQVRSVTYGKIEGDERVYVIYENGYQRVDVSGLSDSALASKVINAVYDAAKGMGQTNE